MRIREAAVAGLFYPKQPAELQACVQRYLREARGSAPTSGIKALVGPHAGFQYSGPIAGSAYAPLKAHAQAISRVLLFSPAHRVHVKGVAATSAHGFRTPLGLVPVDTEAVAEALTLPGVKIHDEAHFPEHGVETHLPFLQEVLNHRASSDSAETQPRWTLIPLLVGDAEPDAVVPILEKFWGGPETLIVVSSDLSHFLDHASATAMDHRTADAIVALDPVALDRVGENSACGRIPLRALLRVAKTKGIRATALDVRNSGDTAGARDQVVGYGAFVIA